MAEALELLAEFSSSSRTVLEALLRLFVTAVSFQPTLDLGLDEAVAQTIAVVQLAILAVVCVVLLMVMLAVAVVIREDYRS